MTAPVDVLEVYDDCIAKLEYHYRDTRAGEEMRNGRAAVADLIAAAKQFPEDPNPYTYRVAHARLRAALARVGGDG